MAYGNFADGVDSGGLGDSSGGQGGSGAGWGNLIGGIMGLLGGNGQNPADAGMPYLNQIPGTISPYYQPYITAGNQALGGYQQQIGNMINNPTGMMNQIGHGYQQSPGYGFQVQQATNAANNAAAAGGMAGSPQEQQQLGGVVNGLANQDYYNYVDRGMNQYNQGFQGLGNLTNMGYNASNELAQSLMSALMSQSQMAYSGQANQNQSQGGSIGNIISGITSLL